MLRKFVIHALHADRVAECLESSPHGSIVAYLRSVQHNIKAFTGKMIWNAHSRVVNLLANDGTDGVPFLDLQRVGKGMFSDFCPDNLLPVVSRMNESWHRAYPKPPMVRMSTRQYPIGCHSSPLEEIDETADQVFNNHSFTTKLPTGRPVDPSGKAKGKGRGVPGAVLRENMIPAERGQWLSFPVTEPTDPPATYAPMPMDDQILDPSMQEHHDSHDDYHNSMEPQLLQDLCNMQQSEGSDHMLFPTPVIESNRKDMPTQLEVLVDRFGTEALHSDRDADQTMVGSNSVIEEVPSWRTTLLNDHKRRLTERWGNPPQTFRRALPGIKTAIADAARNGWNSVDADNHRKITIAEAREQAEIPPHLPFASNAEPYQYVTDEPLQPQIVRLQQVAALAVPIKDQPNDTARKRQKTVTSSAATKKRKAPSKKKKTIATPNLTQSPSSVLSQNLLVRHPSGSMTLELHQKLPPEAYFEPQTLDEKPAWRCGIQHAMGHYYNAGNRTACQGCFTNIKDNVNTVIMDFYLPLSSWSFQPTAPGVVWKPSRPLGTPRRSKSRSHNSIAKDAYWPVKNASKNAKLALQAGIDAVNEVLEARKPKEPPPEPTPEPEPDLGPHPSGSTTMEHGQDLPHCAYFDAQDEGEKLAWRCEVSHALGRYYLAGDKKSCPGCGSYIHGLSKYTVMDFYIPRGVVVRQEAPELSLYKPRKPYKSRKGKAGTDMSKKTKYLTHNQKCNKTYYEAVEAGHVHEDAVKIAIAHLEAELEAKEAELETHDEDSTEDHTTPTSTTFSHKTSANTSQTSSRMTMKRERGPREARQVSLVPAKRCLDHSSDDDDEDGEDERGLDGVQRGKSVPDIIEMHSSSADDDEETSGSDSE